MAGAFAAPAFGLLASADFVPVLFALDCASADCLACEFDLFGLEDPELDLLELESAVLDLLELEYDDEFDFVRLEDEEEDRFAPLLPQLLPEPYDRVGGGGE